VANRDDVVNRLGAFLARMHDLTAVDSGNELADLDLAFSQARILGLLSCADGPLAIHAIAERMNLTLPSAGRNVDRLVRLGLAERDEKADDRRVKLVQLSAGGRDLVERRMDHCHRVLEAMLEPLSGADHDRLFEALAPLTSDLPAHDLVRGSKGTS